MKRRDLLAGTGLAVGTTLAGCLGRFDESDVQDGTDGNGAGNAPPGGDDTVDDGDDTVDDGDDDVMSIDGRFHNEDDEDHTFAVRILDEDGETVVEDDVEVAAGETTRVPALGSPGQTRTFEVAVDGTDAAETFDFDVEQSPERVDGYVDVTYSEKGLEIEFTPAEHDREGDHHLYLENLDDESHRVELLVVRSGADEPVIQGTYEIPAERGGEFREVAAWEETYEVSATLESGLSENVTWGIDPCPGAEAGDEESELEDGSRNGSVRIESGGDDLSFVRDSCDEILAGAAVPTGPAEQFEVDD